MAYGLAPALQDLATGVSTGPSKFARRLRSQSRSRIKNYRTLGYVHLSVSCLDGQNCTADKRDWRHPRTSLSINVPHLLLFFMVALSEKTTHKDAKLAAAEEDAARAGMKSFQLGVWRVCVPDAPNGPSPLAKLHDQVALIRANWPYTRRFLTDTISLAPRLVLLAWTLDLIQAIMPGLRLYFWNLLLTTVRGFVSQLLRRCSPPPGRNRRFIWLSDGRADHQICISGTCSPKDWRTPHTVLPVCRQRISHTYTHAPTLQEAPR
jgi:hypothetical protein